MLTCNSCPYPVRCANRGHCISGKVREAGDSLPQPKPMQVMTTAGMGMTSEAPKTAPKIKTRKKKDAS